VKDVVLLLAGAGLGLGMTVAFEDRFKSWIERRQRLRRARAIRRTFVDADGPVCVAGHRTDFYLIEGDGEAVLEPQRLTVDIRSSGVELPADIAERRRTIAAELAETQDAPSGTVAPWNSPNMVGLIRYRIARGTGREELEIHLDGFRSDYATFAATVLGLDEGAASLRRQYLPTAAATLRAVRSPIPVLAHGIGVALLGFTDDNQVILTRRRNEARARPGERDITVVEGMDAQQDRLPSDQLDAYATAVRGCWEELGVRVSYDDVRFLGFGVDMAYYQWNVLGTVDLHYSADEVIDRYLFHAKDRFEGRLEPVPATPVQVFEALRREHAWDTAVVTAYLALCRRFGVPETRKAANRVFGGHPNEAPWRRRR
jgi:hypothetical protein